MKVDTCIVPQDKWSHFEESYENFVPDACEIAIQSFKEIFDSVGIRFTDLMLWRKFYGDIPTFQHLCFRYKNKIISIILAIYGVEGANAAIMSEHEFDHLIAECRKYNLTPCVFPVDVVNKCPILDGWHMLDALTKTPIDIDEITDEQGTDIWSEWEYNNYGVSEVVKKLYQSGINLFDIKWVDEMGYQPQVYFWTDNKETKNYVIVRTVPAGFADEEFTIDNNIFENLSDWNGYYADIRTCSMWNDLDFQETEVLRIAPYYEPIVNIEPIEEAIKNHKYIRLTDEERRCN